MRPVLSLLLAALGCLPAVAAEPKAADADDWWNAAWAFRKRVEVRLPAAKAIGCSWRPPSDAADDRVAALAVVRCETKLEAGAQREIRVVDAGGNVLPAVVSGPDDRGLVRVTFPARRTITARLAGPVAENTKSVGLDAGRDKAVTPGLRLHVTSGSQPVATLEVESVAAKTSTARVVECSVPQIAKGTPARSDTLAAATYFVYYGNPKPQAACPTWTPPASAVRRYTWQITGGEVPRSVPMLVQTLRTSVSFVAASGLEHISSRANTHATGGEGYYVAAYEGLVHCEIGGLYRFSLDTGGPSFLFLDGKLAAQRPGFFHQTGQWEHRGKTQLEAGTHHLVLFAVESQKRQVTRLGWQPVTAKVYSPIPVSFYTSRVAAPAVGLEARDARQQAFFTYSLAPRTILAGKGARYLFVQFHNHTAIQPPNDEEELSYVWDFGGGEKGREAAPGRLFPLPADRASSASFPVTLRAFAGGRLAGEYSRTVHCDPRPAQKLMVSLDIVSFANIVYEDERTSIAVRLRNANLSPIQLRAIGRLLTEKPGAARLTPDDITHWPQLAAALHKQADADAPSVGKSVEATWQALDKRGSLPAQARPALEAAAEGKELTEPQRAAIVDALNGTLRFRDFYQQDHFQGVHIPAEARGMLVLDRKGMSRDRLETLNRLLLSAAYPDAIAPMERDSQIILRRPVRIEAENEDFCILPVDMKKLSPKRATIELDFFLGGERVRDTSLRIIPSPEELASLRRGLGALFDADGRRIMICADIEDADRHMRWIILRAVRDDLLPRSRGTRRRVLLFGDRMANALGPDKTFTDYVARLEPRLAESRRQLQFVARSTGLLPTLADLILFAKTLRAAKPPPDIIVLSPGLADVAQACGVRDFARSIDVIIDAVRAASPRTKIVIVSPPPYPGNPRLSSHYTKALEQLARKHHIPFLDLHRLLTTRHDDWIKAWYADPEAEGIFLRNPNEAAHQRIADALLKLIY